LCATPWLQLTLSFQSGAERFALFGVHQCDRQTRSRVLSTLTRVVDNDPGFWVAGKSRVQRPICTADHVHEEHKMIVGDFTEYGLGFGRQAVAGEVDVEPYTSTRREDVPSPRDSTFPLQL
jgi:hypothetical protein